MNTYRIFLSTLATACLLLANQSTAKAQNNNTGFAAAQLRGIQSANSISRHTVDNISRRVINQGIPRAGVAGVNRQNFSAGTGNAVLGNSGAPGLTGSSKPFSRIDRGPAVSPYLALSNPFSTPSDFYNIVRPLQNQERVNQQVAKQQYAQSRKLNQIAAQGPFQITGSEAFAPTGHGTGFMRFGTYMNTGSYFAPPTRPKSDR